MILCKLIADFKLYIYPLITLKMKKLFLLLAVTLAGCNNVINEEGETVSSDTIMHDSVNNIDKLNDIINQNQDAGDSIKNVENLEPQLKNNPE